LLLLLLKLRQQQQDNVSSQLKLGQGHGPASTVAASIVAAEALAAEAVAGGQGHGPVEARTKSWSARLLLKDKVMDQLQLLLL